MGGQDAKRRARNAVRDWSVFASVFVSVASPEEYEKIGIFRETSSGFILILSALWFVSGYMSAVFEAGFAGDTALHAVFSSLVGKPRMLVILAGMD